MKIPFRLILNPSTAVSTGSTRRFMASLSLLAVLLAACTPVATSVSPAAVAPSATPLVDTASPTIEAAPTQGNTSTPLSISTSRGPNLEASDPTTVNLASGQIQFVEFFRFT